MRELYEELKKEGAIERCAALVESFPGLAPKQPGNSTLEQRCVATASKVRKCTRDMEHRVVEQCTAFVALKKAEEATAEACASLLQARVEDDLARAERDSIIAKSSLVPSNEVSVDAAMRELELLSAELETQDLEAVREEQSKLLEEAKAFKRKLLEKKEAAAAIARAAAGVGPEDLPGQLLRCDSTCSPRRRHGGR